MLATTISPEADHLLTIQQAAEILQVSVRKVKILIGKGELHSIRVGVRSRRIRMSDLQVFIQKCG